MKNEFESFSRGIVPCTASLNHSGLGLIKILWCLLPYVFINDVCFFFFFNQNAYNVQYPVFLFNKNVTLLCDTDLCWQVR